VNGWNRGWVWGVGMWLDQASLEGGADDQHGYREDECEEA
jgi:hypothetical protein